MRTWLKNIWEYIGGSLWVMPSAFIVVSIGLAFFVTWLDDTYGASAFYRNFPLVYGSGADHSLTILSSIAGSVMTVTGVSFSITIVSLTLASSQFGPRLLRNFMRSFVIQWVIGFFTGTIVYCLVIMWTVGDSWENGGPHLSITVAVGLAILCVCHLIFFVHHVAASIQADSLVAGVYREVERAIEELPEREEGDRQVTSKEARERSVGATSLRSPRSGYLLAIDVDRLREWVKERGYSIIFAYRPGGFIAKGEEIAWLEGAKREDDAEALREKILKFVYLGWMRTPEQDIEYTISQLVEIAVRALSPSINDPKTAEICIDYLAAGLCQLSHRELPNNAQAQEETGSVLVPNTTYAGIVDESFNRIRQSFENQPSVIIRVISGCTRISRSLEENVDRRAELVLQIRQIEQALPRLDLSDKDREDIEARIEAFHSV